MPSTALPRKTVHYLATIGAAAVYITEPLRIGATTAPNLRRLSRGVVWLAWVRSIEDAQRVAAIDAPNVAPAIHLQANHATANVASTQHLPAIVTAIEQRARDLNVRLSPHDKVIERTAVLAARVDETIENFRQHGQLRAFNQCYRLHRARMNGHGVRPYQSMLEDFRGVVIRTLADTPRGEMSPALLTIRLRERFKWFTWYG